MTTRILLACTLLASLAACGDDGGSGQVDAPKAIDAPASTVMEVTCPATPAVTITTQASSFDMPTAAITAGQIVKLVSTATHPIGPFPGGANTDPNIRVPEGQTKCFMFTAAGTFKFICTVHSYAGTLTVN